MRVGVMVGEPILVVRRSVQLWKIPRREPSVCNHPTPLARHPESLDLPPVEGIRQAEAAAACPDPASAARPASSRATGTR